MKKYDKKIIITIFILLIIISISIYFFTKDDDLNNIYKENYYIEDRNELKDNSLDNEQIVIHIEGEVVNTGIISIPFGSRISDAINAAGGATSLADISKINLAYVLQDSQKVYIPSIYDENDVQYITNSAGNSVLINSNGSIENIVNINTASKSELEKLPGIGSSTASKIIDYRNKNGKFKSIQDIMNVGGIGESKFNNIKDYICI